MSEQRGITWFYSKWATDAGPVLIASEEPMPIVQMPMITVDSGSMQWVNWMDGHREWIEVATRCHLGAAVTIVTAYDVEYTVNEVLRGDPLTVFEQTVWDLLVAGF